MLCSSIHPCPIRAPQAAGPRRGLLHRLVPWAFGLLLTLALGLVGNPAWAAVLSPTTLKMMVGEKATVSVTRISGRLSFGNTNTSVASTTYASGVMTVTAKAAGSATLSVKDKTGTATVAVTVLNPMTVSPTALTVIAGQSGVLSVANAFAGPTVTSSAPGVATASVAGATITVQGLTAGSATVAVGDTKRTINVPVTVQAPLAVAPTSASLAVNQTTALTVTGAVGTISLANSDASVISTSLAGTTISVRGLKVGQARLTVRDSRMTVTVTITVTSTISTASYAVMAWNDLGMHCMDADYSVFSILPPFNNLHAQVVNASTGKLVTSGVSLTYEAVADPAGSRNSISSTKTNFWTFVKALFNADLAPDTGLANNKMPGDTPQAMSFDPATNQFRAEGIPITPYDDTHNKNTYPLMKLVARDSAGNFLASARAVLPVSDEMTCVSCHGSKAIGSGAEMAAKPAGGWVFDSDPERDYRRNILRRHDEKSAGSATFAAALATRGYKPAGLLATADAGTPILCAGCHGSNALPGTGIPGIAPLTQAMHAKHSPVLDPTNNLSLNSSSNRAACYQCHPGSETKCLRGAMGAATLADGSLAMQCQSCHGGMSAVGDPTRVGWLQQPNCQGCHYDGQRKAVWDATKGSTSRFATTPNVPSAGFSLYRMSKGHGGLQCEACHGATHAEYPSSHDNDNLLAQDLQDFAGTLHECSTCHKTEPSTISGGPHGMHAVGQKWVTDHHDQVKGIQSTCTACHGADYRGTFLSTVKKAKSFNIGDGRTKAYSVGDKAGCYDCHNGPTGG